MIYRVILQPLAKADLEAAYLWAARHAPETAARWLNRFEAALQTLDRNPKRCPFAREHGRIEGIELRELLFGRRANVYRVIFTVDDDAIRILRIRRAQRRFLSENQLREAVDQERDD